LPTVASTAVLSVAMTRINTLLLLAVLNAAVLAEEKLPVTRAVPGGIAVLVVGPASQPAPVVRFEGKRVWVAHEDAAWHAIVGLPLTADPGTHKLIVRDGRGSERELPFEITPKRYARQNITLRNKRMVDPGPDDLIRIERDAEQIRDAFLTWSAAAPTAPFLDLPAQGRLTARFGLRRYFNNQPRKPHSGIDIAAPAGTAVRAPADAIVLQIGDYFFNGKTLFLDHGQGLVTMYNHLQRIRVSVGDRIRRGDIVGEIGQTGRVTGPHLHWSVSLNDARVDPLLLVRPSGEAAP